MLLAAGAGAVLPPPNENVLVVAAAVELLGAPNDMLPNPLVCADVFGASVAGALNAPKDSVASTVSALLRRPLSGGDCAAPAVDESDGPLAGVDAAVSADVRPNEKVAALGADAAGGAAAVADAAGSVAALGWAPNVNCAGPLATGFSGCGAGALASNATPKLNLLAPAEDSDRAAAVLPNGVAVAGLAAAAWPGRSSSQHSQRWRCASLRVMQALHSQRLALCLAARLAKPESAAAAAAAPPPNREAVGALNACDSGLLAPVTADGRADSQATHFAASELLRSMHASHSHVLAAGLNCWPNDDRGAVDVLAVGCLAVGRAVEQATHLGASEVLRTIHASHSHVLAAGLNCWPKELAPNDDVVARGTAAHCTAAAGLAGPARAVAQDTHFEASALLRNMHASHSQVPTAGANCDPNDDDNDDAVAEVEANAAVADVCAVRPVGADLVAVTAAGLGDSQATHFGRAAALRNMQLSHSHWLVVAAPDLAAKTSLSDGNCDAGGVVFCRASSTLPVFRVGGAGSVLLALMGVVGFGGVVFDAAAATSTFMGRLNWKLAMGATLAANAGALTLSGAENVNSVAPAAAALVLDELAANENWPDLDDGVCGDFVVVVLLLFLLFGWAAPNDWVPPKMLVLVAAGWPNGTVPKLKVGIDAPLPPSPVSCTLGKWTGSGSVASMSLRLLVRVLVILLRILPPPPPPLVPAAVSSGIEWVAFCVAVLLLGRL